MEGGRVAWGSRVGDGVAGVRVGISVTVGVPVGDGSGEEVIVWVGGCRDGDWVDSTVGVSYDPHNGPQAERRIAIIRYPTPMVGTCFDALLITYDYNP